MNGGECWMRVVWMWMNVDLAWRFELLSPDNFTYKYFVLLYCKLLEINNWNNTKSKV